MGSAAIRRTVTDEVVDAIVSMSGQEYVDRCHPLPGCAARAQAWISARGTTIPNGANSVITGSGRVQPAAARAPIT